MFDWIGQAVKSTNDTGMGIYNAYQNQKNYNRKARNINKATKEAQSEYDKIIDLLNQNNENRIELSSPEMVQTYKNLISNYNPEDYVYDFDTFSFDKSVDDYVNPYYDKIIQGTSDALQHTAAGAGLGRGTGAALNIAQGVAEKDNELYKDALSQYNTDRSQAYQEYSDYINNMQNKLNNLSSQNATKINLMSGAIQSDKQDQSDYMSDLISAMSDKAGTKLQGTLSAYS